MAATFSSGAIKITLKYTTNLANVQGNSRLKGM
jgi:hypothetical protein